MLGQAVVLLALVAAFAAAAVAGIAGTARARTAETARALVVPAVESALAAYLRELGATIGAQVPDPSAALTSPPPSIAALEGALAFPARRYVEQAASSVLTVGVDVTPTSTSLPACAPAAPGADSGVDLEVNGQCSPFVQESRLSLAIVATVGTADATGAIAALAGGRTIVTVRLFSQPPYAAVAGIKETVSIGEPHEADVDGYANALGPFVTGTPLPGDTTIHVVFACTPALGDCSQSLPSAADDPTSLPWSNGN